ncbi:hypothetical protein HC021_06690 [Limosilactobacillus fermentum]
MINNALNLKDRGYQIFEHCDLPLHNNHDEQRIHSTTLVRKNKSVHKTNGKRKGQYDLVWDCTNGKIK